MLTVLQYDRLFDYLNLFTITVNVLFAIYLKSIYHYFKYKTGVELITLKTRILVDGILIVESLFFAALYTWVKSSGDETLGGIADPSLFLYLIAEHGKSLYFLSLNFAIWREIRIEKESILLYRRRVGEIIKELKGTDE